MGLRQWMVEQLGGEWPEPVRYAEAPGFQKRGNVLVECANKDGTLLWTEEIRPPPFGEQINVRGNNINVIWHLFAGDIIRLWNKAEKVEG